MGKIVNLRQARKAKARAEAEDTAAANRAFHGTPKSARTLTKARTEKAAKTLDSHRLDRDNDLKE